MSKQTLFYLRIVLFLCLIVGLVCFVALLSFIHKPFASLTDAQRWVTMGYWLGLVAAYTTFFAIGTKNRLNAVATKGRPHMVAGILGILFGVYGVWRFGIVGLHTSTYELVTVIAAVVTYGNVALFLCVGFLVRKRLRKLQGRL